MPRALAAAPIAPVAADPVVDTLAVLVREVAALRADIAELRSRSQPATPIPDAALGDLLREITTYCGDAAFSTRVLVAHAQTAPALSAAVISAVGILNARAVGKVLKRIEGRAIDGLQVNVSGSMLPSLSGKYRVVEVTSIHTFPVARLPSASHDRIEDQRAKGQSMERLSETPIKSNRFTAGHFLQAHAAGKGDAMSAEVFAAGQNWADRSQVVNALKAAQTPITTGDFPGALTPVAESFLGAMRDTSIPLRLVGLRKTPMLTRIFVNTSGVVVAEVAEGAPIPVLAGDWTATTLPRIKRAGLVVQTDELMSSTSPAAALAIVDDLAQATSVSENDAFLDANRSGSVLFGQASFTATGSTLANVDTDLAQLVSLVRGASDPNASFVMCKQTATYLSLLRGTGGATAFPDIGPSGGELLGLQVLVSSACEDADSPSSKIIALVSPSEIFWADEGRVFLMTSNHASLQMSDTPSAAATSTVSMWQSNCTATRAIRESAWYARAGAAAYMRVSY